MLLSRTTMITSHTADLVRAAGAGGSASRVRTTMSGAAFTLRSVVSDAASAGRRDAR